METVRHEPPLGIGPRTSSLPRKCSTTELRRRSPRPGHSRKQHEAGHRAVHDSTPICHLCALRFGDICSPTWARTRDPIVNSDSLCQLSYRGSSRARRRGYCWYCKCTTEELNLRCSALSECPRHRTRRRAWRPVPPLCAAVPTSCAHPGGRTRTSRRTLVSETSASAIPPDGHHRHGGRRTARRSSSMCCESRRPVPACASTEAGRFVRCSSGLVRRCGEGGSRTHTGHSRAPFPFREGCRQAKTRLAPPLRSHATRTDPRFAPMGSSGVLREGTTRFELASSLWKSEVLGL